MAVNGLNREAISEIERVMRECGYSRADLARLLKVSRVTVTQMLAPSSKLSLARLERVVRKMGYTVHLNIQPQLPTRYFDATQEQPQC
jgi:Mn-dependent DtxR family transcriptional regulator